jgi:hypothetical protein
MTCILPKSEQGLSEEIKQSKAMFTLYRITLRPTQKSYRIGLLFTYEMLLSGLNFCSGPVVRRFATSLFQVVRGVSD